MSVRRHWLGLPAKWRRGRRDCLGAVAPARAERDWRGAGSKRSDRRWRRSTALRQLPARGRHRRTAFSARRAGRLPRSIRVWGARVRSVRREELFSLRGAPYWGLRPGEAPVWFAWAFSFGGG